MEYSEVAKELGIDPAQGIEELLADAGELVIGGRLVKAPAKPAVVKPSAKSATEKDGE